MITDLSNPWHRVPVGPNAPEIVNGIIEIPKNTRAKYELDKESGLLKMDRVLFSSINYPQNYGFIPQTYCDDNDPLDILILSQIDVVPLCLVEANVIGAMRMIDGGEMDDKIIAVASHDMSVNHYTDIDQLPQHFLVEMQSFFEDYKKLEKKTVAVEGFQHVDVAHKIILESIDMYNDLKK